MRVLQLFKNYYPPTHGGIEQLINSIVHRIPDIEFAVLTSSHSGELVDGYDGDVRVVRAPELIRVSTAPIVPKWSRLIRELDPDVVHVHMPNPTGELAALMSRTRARIVASFHAEIVRAPGIAFGYRSFLRAFWPRVHTVMTGSPPLRDTSAELKAVRARTRIVPYGIDPDEWAVRPALADELRAKYPGPLVFFLGLLRHYKGAHVLVEAMRDVEGTLLIAGEGPQRAEVRAAIERFEVGHRVHMLGAIRDEDRAAYMHAADVFVLPAVNRAEAFGIVLLQAMACGTPVISTELGTGTSWVNEEGGTGYVVPARHPRALAGAIARITEDAGRRAAMSAAARERVRTHFTQDQMFATLKAIYEGAAQAR